MASTEDSLILSKSLALIEKTKMRVVQVDANNFPTDSSKNAKLLLLDALSALGETSAWSVANPAALYNALIRFQSLVDEVETSNSEHISWPLVSYCNRIWRALFPSDSAEIFYSVTSQHNYMISSFSKRLEELLIPILPPTRIAALMPKHNLYCLQLASLEEENLPLYANIGHEFGHALFWSSTAEIFKILKDECDPAFKLIATDLHAKDPSLAVRRIERASCIVVGIATEMFCDLLGSIISGPAYLLSLYEMGWGSDQANWTGMLLPIHSHIIGYPSFRFRLQCVKRWARVITFEADAVKAFPRLNSPDLRTMAGYLSTVPTDHSLDHVTISPDSDSDRTPIESALTLHLSELKAGLEKFLERTHKEVLVRYGGHPDFAPISGDNVFHLLHRLENEILPNIIPDGTLLGVSSNFGSILNASALFRANMLLNRSSTSGPDTVRKDIQKIERLTAKALEVSYVQSEFINWEKTKTP